MKWWSSNRHLHIWLTLSQSESVAYSAGATDSAFHRSTAEVVFFICRPRLGSVGVGEEDSLDSAGDLQRLMAPGLLAGARWPLAPFITLHSVDRYRGNTRTLTKQSVRNVTSGN